jgi:multidrug efflux system outer membrane protein
MQAETQLAMTQADVPHRKSNVVAAINRLTVLTGKHPDSLHQELVKTQPLPSLPISVKVGNVSELMKNRPDIKAAERRLAAATAKYNVAVADQFPSVNIVGGLGFIATNLANLGTSSAITAAIGPSMSWGVFDMGRIRSRIEQNDSISKAALANYELAVMEALEETRTAVHDFAREEERREHLKKAASSSIQATVIAKQRFTLGDTDFLPVLDSERTRLSAEDALAVSEIQSAVNLVRIYKAIGRGWKHTGEDGTS